jgi:hypothetical protein
MRQSEIQELNKSKGSKQSRAADRNKPVLGVFTPSTSVIVGDNQPITFRDYGIFLDDYNMLQTLPRVNNDYFSIPRSGKYEIIAYLSGFIIAAAYGQTTITLNTWQNGVLKHISYIPGVYSASGNLMTSNIIIALPCDTGDKVNFTMSTDIYTLNLTEFILKINLLR